MNAMVLPRLDVRPNQNVGKRFVCTHVFPELTALCPVTKLPDFYTLEIRYEPDQKLIELKSLKLYLVGYRETETLHEEITNMIMDDFIKAVQPRWIHIEVRVNVRGGIATTVSRYWSKEHGDELPPEFSERIAVRHAGK